MTETPHLARAWRAKVITLFPEVFPGVLGASLTGKALQQGLWTLEAIDLRTFGTGKHRQVDDTPAGGGAGLVMKPDVMGRAFDMARAGTPSDRAQWPIVYLSPRGKPFDQRDAERFAQANGMTLICGRFEGLDQRVIDHYALEEVSIGDLRPDRRRNRRAGPARRHRAPAARRPRQRRLDARRKASPTACWNTRNSPNPPNGAATRSRRCCSRATTARWRNGAANRLRL